MGIIPPMSEALEIEVKLRLPSRDEAVTRLGRLGAEPRDDRHFEDNEIFDTESRALGREGSLLRLRITGGNGVITFKEKVETDLNAKVRRETETAVSDPGAVRSILRKLGLVTVYRYQKYRSYYGWRDPDGEGDLCISLDETPIGVFVELEGAAGSIDRAARIMGYSGSDYILDDYRSLHRAHLRERGLPDGDLLFDPRWEG
jgi:adenylate cyclase class 2